MYESYRELQITMLSILCASLLFMSSLFALDPYTKYTQLNLPFGASGPDSVALDRFRGGPYVAIGDGRILKYNGASFEDFAYTSPNRTKALCDGTSDLNLGPICGRPFGFSFNPITGVLFIVDAYHGLFKVGPKGGQATLLSNSADGGPFMFLNGVDVDLSTGHVYFTDASLIYGLKDVIEGKFSPTDSTGRLMRYNPITRQVKVLLQGLPAPGGSAASVDGAFVLFSQFFTQQVVKYWIKGLKANTTQVLLNLPGNPIKIKRAPNFGEFWVPINQVPINQNFRPSGYKFNSDGQILVVKDLSEQYTSTRVDVIQEHVGVILYVGSRQGPFVGIYSGW